MLTIWSMLPLPFFKSNLNIWQFIIHILFEAWLGEFWVLYYYHVRWVQLCGSLSILWDCLFWALECKLTFSSPVAAAEFSKFADLLSATLSQHHLFGCFWTVVWRRLLRVPWTTRRSKQSILKEISPEYSLEELMLKLKLQYIGHLMWRTDSLEKTLMLGKTECGRRGRERMRQLLFSFICKYFLNNCTTLVSKAGKKKKKTLSSWTLHSEKVDWKYYSSYII